MSPRADLSTRLRLASGLVLMAFTASHLVNHALGIHSLQAMEQGRAVFVAIWRSPPGTLLLFGALLGHVALALLKLYRRRSLRMPLWELAQIGLGLLIPFWLTVHVIGTFGIHLRFGVEDDYAYLLNLLWPGGAGRQSLMLLIVWLHGCIGIHFWLRIRPWYRAAQPLAARGRPAAADARPGRLRQRRARGQGAGRGRSGLARRAGRGGRLARSGRDGPGSTGPRARCCWASAWCCWPRSAAAGCARCASAMAA